MTTQPIPPFKQRELALAARLLELERLKAEQNRRQFTIQYPHPGDLAVQLQPQTTKQTPALRAIDHELRQVAEGKRSRLMLFVPPQEGKSTRTACWYPLWRLASDPTLRIAIVSYSQGKASRWGKWIRRMVEAHPELGIRLMAGSRAADRFETDQGGRILSVGIEGGITGEAVDELIIDDPVRGRAEAESPTYREAAWEWWESNAMTRASSRFRVIVMMCMTGDTLVLMADGTETPLRDIRPGDAIATYEAGKITTSRVANWANQGPDSIYEIRMKSGVTVRANARHPFLTVQDGVEAWRRTGELKPGHRILRAIGANGEAPRATKPDATSPRDVKASACRTTAGPAGPQGTGLPPPILNRAGQPVSSTATASRPKNSTAWWPRKTDGALLAASPPPSGIPGLIGTGSSASTTITAPVVTVDCSATTAICSSATGAPRSGYEPPLSTWNVTPDEVVEVVPAGVEDVFDVQVDRTENFIASGLVSHNTRWHADDLAGRLLKEEPGEWRVLRIPALREDADREVRAPDGESVYDAHGELVSVQDRAPGWFRRLKELRSQYVWLSVYAQSPVAAEGNLFRSEDFRYWYRLRPDQQYHDQCGGYMLALHGFGGEKLYLSQLTRFITMDLAASTKTSADFTVACAWGLTDNGMLLLLDVARKRIQEGDHFALVKPFADRWAIRDVYVERGFIGTTLVIRATQAGYAVKPVSPDKDKITRALPAVDLLRQNRIFLPNGVEWLGDYLAEMAAFPQGAHDDQVDATSYAVRVRTAHWLPPVQQMAPSAREDRFVRPSDPEVAFQAQTGTTPDQLDYRQLYF